MKERKKWLDALRALAILLVVFGHQVGNEIIFFQITGPIEMPLFFVISGYLFNDRNGNINQFISHLTKRLIIPWLALGMFVSTPFLLHSFGRFLIAVKDILLGESIWFMPCLIIGEMILFLLLRFKNLVYISVSSFLCMALGLLMSHYDLLDVLMINRAFVVQVFFLIGILIKKYESDLMKVKTSLLIGGFVIYIILVYLGTKFYPYQSIDVHLNRYFNIPLCLLMIIVGCVTILLAFARFNVKNKVLTYIGQNSLVLYIFHSLIITIGVRVLNHYNIHITNVWISAVFKTVLAVILCGLLSYFFNKYIPCIVGRVRK